MVYNTLMGTIQGVAEAPLHIKMSLKTCKHCGELFIDPHNRPRCCHCSVECRLLSKTTIDAETGCWNWNTGLGSHGYGQIKHEGESLAHRVSYVAFKGPIPDDRIVCHTCDNRACINPDHLWLGTYSDNMSDMHAKGRGYWQNRGKK